MQAWILIAVLTALLVMMRVREGVNETLSVDEPCPTGYTKQTPGGKVCIKNTGTPQQAPDVTKEFRETIDMYRTNLLQYKVTGNAGFKTAADTAKKWLDDYLLKLNSETEAGKKDIQDFVKNYESSASELASLKKDMATIRKKGPELQTIYETEHETQKEASVDFSIYYTKGAVLGGIMALVAVASMF